MTHDNFFFHNNHGATKGIMRIAGWLDLLQELLSANHHPSCCDGSIVCNAS
jgi:hypothetical protein